MSVLPLLYHCVFEVPQGKILLLATPRGLARVVLGPEESIVVAMGRLSTVAPKIAAKRGSSVLVEVRSGLRRCFSGRRVDFSSVPLDLGGATEFQTEVWRLASEIPFGSVHSYGWLAEKLGSIDYARAVGQALARNPVPVVVPCHRIIEESGERGGYTGASRLRTISSVYSITNATS